jgi:DNA-directed RNA polymerase subunit E'/Rpb7
MSLLTLIEKRICLESKYLDSNIQTHLFNKIKEKTKDECTKENGCIVKVIDIKKIINQYVSPATCEIIFNVQFEAETINPKVGDILTGIICVVYEQGIFIEIHKKLTIFVSEKYLGDYIFNNINSNYEIDNDKVSKDSKQISTLSIGTKITVKILGIQYIKQQFKCFGEIIF